MLSVAPADAVAPSDPGRRVSYAYAAPERGYPDRRCRVCGRRPCAVRLGWSAGRAPTRLSGHAHFCAEHTVEANRACRALKAGELPPCQRPPGRWADGDRPWPDRRHTGP
jgi:hypothetical protein